MNPMIPKPRKNYTSAQFIKRLLISFLATWFIFSVIFSFALGAFFGALFDSIGDWATPIIAFVIFLAAWYSAIQESFKTGRIHREDVPRIKKNIWILVSCIFVVHMLVLILRPIIIALIIGLPKTIFLHNVRFYPLIIGIYAVQYAIAGVICRIFFTQKLSRENSFVQEAVLYETVSTIK